MIVGVLQESGLALTTLLLTFQSEIPEDKVDLLADLQWPDEQLYAHFKAKFDLKLAAYGHDRMSRSLSELRSLNTWVTSLCVTSSHVQRSTFTVVDIRESVPFCFRHGANEYEMVGAFRTVMARNWERTHNASKDEIAGG